MTLAVGLGAGLAASLALAELLSIAPGGYIVPGYIAVTLSDPQRVAATVGIAMLTVLVMKLVGRFVLLYGMRRFVLFLLVGFALGIAYAAAAARLSNSPIEAIGFVIPGLIANWMDRQGAVVTLASMITVAIVARFVLLLVVRL